MLYHYAHHHAFILTFSFFKHIIWEKFKLIHLNNYIIYNCWKIAQELRNQTVTHHAHHHAPHHAFIMLSHHAFISHMSCYPIMLYHHSQHRSHHHAPIMHSFYVFFILQTYHMREIHINYYIIYNCWKIVQEMRNHSVTQLRNRAHVMINIGHMSCPHHAPIVHSF